METLDPLVEDFLTVAGLAGMSIRRESIITQVLPPPHQPRSLPRLKQGVYAFLLGDRCLKVGKAGPLSSPRYTSQHYNPKSSKSNLARSILKSKSLLKKELHVELHPSIILFPIPTLEHGFKRTQPVGTFLLEQSSKSMNYRFWNRSSSAG